nr:hypothetical protein [Tanacetum cinerariifolium]
MDVKSAFLYGKIEKKVYVCQSPGFEDPEFRDKVYKIEKDLYGLHHALRACQDKYVVGILKKFDFSTITTASTPIEPNKALVKDVEAEDVDVHLYRSIIGSLMYLTASRPDITFAVCACATFQVTLKTSHLHVVKRKEYVAAASCCGQVLWIQNQMLNYGFNLMNTKIYIDNGSTNCIVKNPGIDSGSGPRYALTVNLTVYASCVKKFWTTTTVKKVNGQEQIQALVDKQKVIILEESIRRDHKYDDAEGTVLNLEEAKTAQAKEIAKLKKRVKKLEKRRNSRPAGLRRLKKVGSSKQVESSEEKDSLGAQDDASKHGNMFEVDDLEGNEVFIDVREKIVEKEVSTVDPVTTAGEAVTVVSVEDSVAPTTATTADVDDELTLEKTLIAIKAAKPNVISTVGTTVTTDIITPRAKGIVFHEQVQAHIPTISSSKNKDKAKIIEPEKPLKKKDQLALDKEVARMLEAKMKKEERVPREKDEENRDVIEEWDDVLTINADRQRKYFAAKRAKEIINKPPIKASQKSLMCTYMKNMEGFKQKDFKGKSFDDIKKIFEKVYKRVVDMDTNNVEESLKKTQAEGNSKRARQELKQEKLKRCLEIVPEDDDDVAIEATPLSSKYPTIVDYKIYREGNKSYFKIIKADGNLQNYLTFR